MSESMRRTMGNLQAMPVAASVKAVAFGGASCLATPPPGGPQPAPVVEGPSIRDRANEEPRLRDYYEAMRRNNPLHANTWEGLEDQHLRWWISEHRQAVENGTALYDSEADAIVSAHRRQFPNVDWYLMPHDERRAFIDVYREMVYGAKPAPVARPVEEDPQPDIFDAVAEARDAQAAGGAVGILDEAAGAIRQRAASRDLPQGERSMARTVAAFNAMTGRNLTETEGWLFMVQLKAARATAGAFNRDDYVDMAGYAALAGESAAKDARA